MLHVAQHKNFPVLFSQRIQRLGEQLPDLFPFQSLRRDLTPVCEIAGRIVALLVLVVNDRLNDVGVFSPLSHARLIDANLNQPGAEARFREHLHECKTCQVIVDSTKKTIRIVTDSDSFSVPADHVESIVKDVMARIRDKKR